MIGSQTPISFLIPYFHYLFPFYFLFMDPDTSYPLESSSSSSHIHVIFDVIEEGKTEDTLDSVDLESRVPSITLNYPSTPQHTLLLGACIVCLFVVFPMVLGFSLYIFLLSSK
jgi:hypothetical protein